MMRGFTKKYKKYKVVKICPNISYGASTGHPPIQVRRIHTVTKDQNINWLAGINALPRRLGSCVSGSVNRISMAANIATTPPNLLGIDRRMAYAQRKYHSGLMWAGVDSGLAGIKFSGSPRILGPNNASAARVVKKTINPNTSFEE